MLAVLFGYYLLGQQSLFVTAPTAVPSSTQPTVVIVERQASTTQPAVIAPQTLQEAFAQTRLAQIAEGQKKVTLKDILQLDFWLDTIRELIVLVLSFIPRVLVSLLFLVIFWAIFRAVRRMVLGAMHRASVDPSIRDLLITLIKWSIMGFGLVIACNQMGIPIVAMLTGVSILGLAVGFAAQETLANFIAGIVIFWDRPFKVGDWLAVDGEYGQVNRITFRSTRILNLSGEIIILPNTYMLANKVANHSTHPVTRIKIPIGIAYKDSIDAARVALLGTLAGDSRVLADPGPDVVVDKCDESSVNLLLRFWITDESLEHRFQFEYIEKAKKALDAAGIEIPFPHMQVLMEKPASTVGSGAAIGQTAVN